LLNRVCPFSSLLLCVPALRYNNGHLLPTYYLADGLYFHTIFYLMVFYYPSLSPMSVAKIYNSGFKSDTCISLKFRSFVYVFVFIHSMFLFYAVQFKPITVIPSTMLLPHQFNHCTLFFVLIFLIPFCEGFIFTSFFINPLNHCGELPYIIKNSLPHCPLCFFITPLRDKLFRFFTFRHFRRFAKRVYP